MKLLLLLFLIWSWLTSTDGKLAVDINLDTFEEYLKNETAFARRAMQFLNVIQETISEFKGFNVNVTGINQPEFWVERSAHSIWGWILLVILIVLLIFFCILILTVIVHFCLGFCVFCLKSKKEQRTDDKLAAVVVAHKQDKKAVKPPIPAAKQDKGFSKTKEMPQQPMPFKNEPVYPPYPNKDAEFKHQDIADKLVTPLAPVTASQAPALPVVPPRKFSVKNAQTDGHGTEEKDTQTDRKASVPHVPVLPVDSSVIPVALPVPETPKKDIPEITRTKHNEIKEVPIEDYISDLKTPPPYPVNIPPYPLTDMPIGSVPEGSADTGEKDAILEDSLDEDEFKDKVRGKETMPGRNRKGPRKELLV